MGNVLVQQHECPVCLSDLLPCNCTLAVGVQSAFVPMNSLGYGRRWTGRTSKIISKTPPSWSCAVRSRPCRMPGPELQRLLSTFSMRSYWLGPVRCVVSKRSQRSGRCGRPVEVGRRRMQCEAGLQRDTDYPNVPGMQQRRCQLPTRISKPCLSEEEMSI